VIILGEPDAGDSHDVQLGDEVLIRLPENPTTGHRWHLRVSPDGLALLDDTFMASPLARPGSGGTREFRLRVTQPGGYVIDLASRRSWETAESAAARLEFFVRVIPQ
jgi:inhibitor of cysteine peptidase